MSVKIRMTRKGKKGNPFYRIIATDESSARDGRYLEVIGTYCPTTEPPQVTLRMDRLDYWKKNGARLSETVARIVQKQQKSAQG